MFQRERIRTAWRRLVMMSEPTVRVSAPIVTVSAPTVTVSAPRTASGSAYSSR